MRFVTYFNCDHQVLDLLIARVVVRRGHAFNIVVSWLAVLYLSV